MLLLKLFICTSVFLLSLSLFVFLATPLLYSVCLVSAALLTSKNHHYYYITVICYLMFFDNIYSSPSLTGMYLQITANILPVNAIQTTLTALGTRAAYCPK